MTAGAFLPCAALMTGLLSVSQLVDYALLPHVWLGLARQAPHCCLSFGDEEGIGDGGLPGWVVDAQTALGVLGRVELPLHYISKGSEEMRND